MPKEYREVYTIIPKAGKDYKDKWVKIGVSFTNSDGSENVQLDALPLTGRLQLRKPKPKDKAED